MTATPTHRFNQETKRIEAIVPEAESDESQQSSDTALDAFVEANAKKLKDFLRDLLLQWESGESELGNSEDSEKQLQDSKPAPAMQPPQKKKPVVAYRNGQPLEVGA